MKELDAPMIIRLLVEEHLMKPGESDSFSYDDWDLTLRREDPKYLPFKYAINGKNRRTGGYWSRRYYSMDRALLHVLNRFNENVNVQDKYHSLEEAFMLVKK